MIKTKVALVALLLCLPVLSGCGMVGLAQLPHKDPENWRTFDPNDYGVEIERKENGAISYSWSLDANFAEENTVPYWKKPGNLMDLNIATVKGQLNQNTYPVIFDTGCNPMVILGEKIVTDNDLAVFFFNPKKKGNSSGLVIADSLKIGSFELTDYPCSLWRHRAEFQLLGLPIYKPELIIIPLEMMRQFSYFKYDNLNKEVSFSKTTSFSPENSAEWLSLPFKVEGLFLLLDVSIEGINTTLRLDTGAGYELELDNAVAQKLFEKRPDFEKAWKKTTHIYGPYEGGKIAQKKFTAKNIQFADQLLDRIELMYTNTEEQKQYQGTIGFELFEKTVMVLDFENNLMWVKKAKDSRFEESK